LAERGGEVAHVNKKTIGIVLIVVGIAVLAVSAAADPLGIGGGNAVFGPRQLVGTVIGVLVIAGGVVLRMKK
jgi:hypothetical protein